MDVSTAAMRELGACVRRLRTDAGLSLRALEELVPFSNAKISLIENGHRFPTVDDLVTLLDAIGVQGEDRDEVLGMHRSADSAPGQIEPGPPSIGPQLAKLIDYEERASRITNWAPLLVPGLLQTAGYARAIMGDLPGAETRVRLRTGRRDIITRRRNAVELHAILDSEVLVRPVAPSDVMIDQLHFLLEMAKRPNITVQILPSTTPGYQPGLAGAFELIEFPTAPPVVHAEHVQASTTLWKKEDVQGFVQASDIIIKKAMTPAESAGVIGDIVNGMETT